MTALLLSPAARKAIARARYRRRYARHPPVVVAQRAEPPRLRLPPQLVIRGFVSYMRAITDNHFGKRGKWGHGRYQHATKSGPGRRPIARKERIRPAGTGLIRRFIRGAAGEATAYRQMYLARTGKQP